MLISLTLSGNAATLLHRYSFSSSAADEGGDAHGILMNGASIQGGAVVLNGVDQYVDLPNGLVSTLTSISVETWVMDEGSSGWARIFDFGNSTAGEDFPIGIGSQGTSYMFLSTPSGPGTLRGAYTVTGGGGGEQLLEWPGTPLPVGQWKHVVWASDGLAGSGSLYVDGVLVASNPGMQLTPADLGMTVNNWLGRSQWPDPLFLGRMDEFRIYDGVLSAAQVQQNFMDGPDQPPFAGPVRITAQPVNQTVEEGGAVVFSSTVAGAAPIARQWTRNSTPLPGETNSTLTLTAALGDHLAGYQLHATNVVDATVYTTSSVVAVLSVLPDVTPPTLVSVTSLGTTGVMVRFSEAVLGSTATSPANYTLSGTGGVVSVVGANLSEAGDFVTLQTPTLGWGEAYVLAVSNIQDRAAAGNVIAPGSHFGFTVTPYVLQDIGGPPSPGTITIEGEEIVLTSSGAGSSGDSDQLTFASQTVSGDFDIRVRVVSVDLGDLWAGGGLMVRASADTNSAFAAIYATPGPVGCYLDARSATGNSTDRSGSFPANHPHTWLRLQRTGSSVTAYAGIDGSAWTRVAQATVTLPATVEVGLVALSSDTAVTTAARFRDAGDTVNPTTTSMADLPFEPMGPSSRNIGLVVSEIMYHPRDALNTNSLEYIELHNPEGVAEDLSRFKLEGDIAFTFPEGTLLPAGGYLVVARIPGAIEAAYGLTGVLGPFDGNLSNSRGTVRVLNELGGAMLDVDYDSRAPWPMAADGTGHSLVLRRPSYGEGDPRAWAQSDRLDGSPGRADGVSVDRLGALCINEYLAHTDDPVLDQIELFNRGDVPLVLDGLIISDRPDQDRFVVPPGTTIPGGGYRVYDQNQLGFALSAAGGWVLLKSPDGTRILDAVQYGGQENGVSTGRSPDGSPSLARLQSTTFGSPNTRIAVSPVAINELMAHPISGDDDDQFLELYNTSGASVDLSGWTFADGISFEFPSNTVLSAGGYLVVARNRERMLGRYPGLSPDVVLGDFGGRLSHGSERVALAMPDEIVDVVGTVVTTNRIEIVLDEVTYVLGGRWGQWVDGGGSSLERIDPRADGRLAPNWGDSDETGKAPWSLIEVTGVMDHGMNSGQGTPNRFEMLLQGVGECLVDEIECRENGGANRISNPGLDGNGNGWVGQGTHQNSGRTTLDAYSGLGSLLVSATGRGDTGANRIRTAISELSPGQSATLRARARWLKGNPYLLLRVRGNWIEAPGVLSVPTNLGTPGAVNSRWASNAPPAVVDVRHAPVQPAAGEPVRVTARVDDPDGVAQVTLTYRLDPGTSTVNLALRDDGAAGDARAGDGIYTTYIPGQVDDAMIAFSIQAQDAGGMSTRFPDRSVSAEALIHFGEENPVGSLGSYHAWCTQDALTTWANREKNSNHPLDCTFTYGQSRVIYQGSILYSGSPFHTPIYTGPLGVECDYEMEFPGDDLFLGTDDFVLVVQNPRSNAFFLPDSTIQAEDTAYWIGRKLGQIYNHKRWVYMYLNGERRTWIHEDTQQPNADLLDVYYPDHPEARLHKIEDWFEFDDGGGGFDYRTATLQDYTTTGGEKKLARYRWTWRPRAGTEPNDFTDLFSLVEVVQAPSPEPYTSRTESLIDMRAWLSCIAVHHIVGDWDSYGYRRGKNMFAYKPGQGPWRLLLWDIDFALGAASSDGPTTDLFDTSGEGDPRIARMFNHPPFRRLYLAIMQDAADGPLAPGAADPMLDERFSLFQDHGIPAQDPASIKNYMAQRRAYILSQLPAATFAVDGPTSRIISGNLLTLTGSAPIEVRSILVNGVPYPAIWTGVTDWTIQVPVAAGSQSVVIQALDRDGVAMAGASRTLTVTSTAPAVDPRDWVVINEIMHHPPIPGGAYVEILNRHPSAAFDLSGWRLNGLGHDLPPGTWIGAGGFHVVAEDRFDYAEAFGPLTALAAEYGGTLDAEGETLTLFEPGATPGTEDVVDRVRYEASAPWPSGAAQPGVALQLVDAAQDNSRVGNWTVGGSPQEPRWIRVTGVGTATSSTLYMYLESAGDIYLDDVTLVAGAQPGVGPNLLTNGDFESALSGPWSLAANMTGSSIRTEYSHGGTAALHLVASSGGSSSGSSISQVIAPGLTIGADYAVSFWYRESDNGGPLVIRLSGSGIRVEIDPAPPTGAAALATPAAVNSVVGSRIPYPPLWLNELQVDHTTGPTNAAGEFTPWMELYNAGTSAMALDGYFLSLDTNNLLDEAFPVATVLAAGEYRVVFGDGRTDLASPEEWHTAFTLPVSTGLVLLARNGSDGPDVVDYLKYTLVPIDSSYGDVPDGQPFYRQLMSRATAGASNSGAVAPLEVIISEWMADNGGAWGLVDPVDGDSDDWFELFNPGATEADLGGYYLTDDLASPLKYLIPSGYTVAAGDYLLVWADGEPEQNHPVVPHLHAGFRLGAGGEAIGLFAPDRTPIDTVTFGPQSADVSEGLLPGPGGVITPLAPTPGGQNFLTLPGTQPTIMGLQLLPGPSLQVGYTTLPGAVYRTETVTNLLDEVPTVLGPSRMAFDAEFDETLILPAVPDPHRVYLIRRVR